jgi:predicted dehydrogenase
LEIAEIASHDWTEGVEVVFEKGRLLIEFSSPMLQNQPARVQLSRAGDRNETVLPRAPWTWAFRRQAEAFLNDVTTNSNPLASGRDALGDLQLAEAIWRRRASNAS